MNIIVLAGGKVDYKNLSLGGYDSYGMYPVRGKPFISWVIDNLVERSKNIIVVVDHKNINLINFLKNHKNFYVKVVINNSKEDNILESLKFGLKFCAKDLPTKIVLGDTMVLNEPKEKWDSILTSSDFYTSKRWCLVEKDKNDFINRFFDKQNFDINKNSEAVVGIYNIRNTVLFDGLCRNNIKNKESSLIKILEDYNREQPIKSVTIKDWLDFGNPHSIVKASHTLFNKRHFNSLSVDEKGIITKSSIKKDKLNNEYNWFVSIPDELKIFTPRIISRIETATEIKILSEIYGYQSLAEIFVYGNKTLEDWCYILERLIKSYNFFLEYKCDLDKNYLKLIYRDKTIERINLIEKDDFFCSMLNDDYIVINNKKYKNFKLLKKITFEKINSLLNNSSYSSVIHGDLCFSNILLDPINYFVKFIDPRGDFIYGDPRYDMAKIRHSVCGLYDFIVLDEYSLLKNNDGSFEIKIFVQDNTVEVSNKFDELIEKNGFNLEEIKFIEALLFLTMIPLHKDDQTRQTAFYLNSIIKLNSIL